MNFHNKKTHSMNKNNINLLQTYNLKHGLNQFGKEGLKAVQNEMKQLHKRNVFEPINPYELTKEERNKAMESLIFLTEKKDGRIKARMCANRSIQRVCLPKDDAASPTVSTESILITSTIEAKHNRDIMTADIPNAFVQTDIKKEYQNKLIMKIRGQLVNMFTKLEPSTYVRYVSNKITHLSCMLEW